MIFKFIFIWFILIPSDILAADLIDVWNKAKIRNHDFIISQIDESVGEYHRKQGRSLWLPNIYFTATTGKIQTNSSTVGATFSAPGIAGRYNDAIFDTSIKNGNINKNIISIIQPLYDIERLTDSEKLNYLAKKSNISAELAHQNLILLVTEKYFDVLLAEENLKLLLTQQQYISNIYQETIKLLKLGDATKTDLQETIENLGAIKIRIISCEDELNIKKMSLADLLGENTKIKQLKDNLSYKNFIFLAPLDYYIQKMKINNLQLKTLKFNQKIACSEAKKYNIISSIKLNAIGNLSKNNIKGSNNRSYQSKDYLLGLQLSVPIFSGGYRLDKEKESLQLLEKTKIEYEKKTLEIEHSIRHLWFYLSSSYKKIKALEDNLLNNKIRLELTIKGHKLGSRSTLEVLKSQNDNIKVQNILFTEKINYLLNLITINFLTGNLSEKELQKINDFLC